MHDWLNVISTILIVISDVIIFNQMSICKLWLKYLQCLKNGMISIQSKHLDGWFFKKKKRRGLIIRFRTLMWENMFGFIFPQLVGETYNIKLNSSFSINVIY